MKILVVEDKGIHQESARQTLKGHHITIACDYKEAMNFLEDKIDEKKLEKLLREIPEELSLDLLDTKKMAKYWELRQKAEEQSIIPFPYEAVLTDLIMPKDANTSFEEHKGVPYGFIIALKAVLRGTTFVAVVTDVYNHNNEIGCAIRGELGGCWGENPRPNFTMNQAKVFFISAPLFENNKGDNVKDWGKVLADLTAS